MKTLTAKGIIEALLFVPFLYFFMHIQIFLNTASFDDYDATDIAVDQITQQ